jgi:hypothetical protein
MISKSEPAAEMEAGDAANVAGASRRPWTAPRLQRLATSSAELGSAIIVDSEGHS